METFCGAEAGIEPARSFSGKRRILSPLCLPISPLGHNAILANQPRCANKTVGTVRKTPACQLCRIIDRESGAHINIGLPAAIGTLGGTATFGTDSRRTRIMAIMSAHATGLPPRRWANIASGGNPPQPLKPGKKNPRTLRLRAKSNSLGGNWRRQAHYIASHKNCLLSFANLWYMV
jgi:hypothetical protein